MYVSFNSTAGRCCSSKNYNFTAVPQLQDAAITQPVKTKLCLASISNNNLLITEEMTSARSLLLRRKLLDGITSWRLCGGQKETASSSFSDYTGELGTAKSEIPEPPTTCCMSGCANCVWLDYVEKLTDYYRTRGEKVSLDKLLLEVDANLDDEIVKAFIKMEIQCRHKFGNHDANRS